MQSRLARLIAFVFVLLSFSLLVCAVPAPAVAPADNDLVARGGCGVGCNTGNQVVDILLKLKADIAIKLGLLDGCYNDGTDPSGIIADIVILINAAVALILACPKDLLGLLNGKILVIVNLCVSIVITIATHCAKWCDKPDYDDFLTLIVVLDVALKGLLSACGGLLGTILGLIAGLLGGANLALLIKVKFYLCIGILGL
ncbi:hypothetical protein FS749_014114 [Ceratobasidium sp. UAMH 11750]|nr:hypothetical protein FS749_014114 [Ceratobasidium sp. UAMH 11750]